MIHTTGVAIVGAGPYGLSIAAHLRARGIDARIFGKPMETWRSRMPKGMFLKSEGFASSLYDPQSTFTLARYCREQNIPYADLGVPVALATFSSYGLAFAKKFVPELDERQIVRITPNGSGFELRLDDDDVVRAAKVIVAVGLTYFQYVPEELAALPPGALSHSSAHHDLSGFNGHDVTVIGAGASAVDTAVLLHGAGATTHLVARTPKLLFHAPPPPKGRSLFRRLRYPLSGLGNGWKSRFYSDMPDAFYHLPESTRVKLVRTALGPAPCWFTRAPFDGNVHELTSVRVHNATVRDDRVRLHLTDVDGGVHEHSTDHLIAATGYRVDVDRLGFLGDELRKRIQTVAKAPALSRNFESTVPNLYFTGISAANSFGPLLRFAFGAGFAARRLTKHLAA